MLAAVHAHTAAAIASEANVVRQCCPTCNHVKFYTKRVNPTTGEEELWPEIEAPKTEAPKTEVPEMEMPEMEMPKTEKSKTEKSKTEMPKTTPCRALSCRKPIGFKPIKKGSNKKP